MAKYIPKITKLKQLIAKEIIDSPDMFVNFVTTYPSDFSGKDTVDVEIQLTMAGTRWNEIVEEAYRR